MPSESSNERIVDAPLQDAQRLVASLRDANASLGETGQQLHQLKLWTNATFPTDVTEELFKSTTPHQWLVAENTSKLNLTRCPPDVKLAQAHIAFGQPDADQLLELTDLRWVHLTSAGYTLYDRNDLREWCKRHNVAITTSSGVYDEPCAQHVLSMMMAFARQLPYAWMSQQQSCDWPSAERRVNSFLLGGQLALIVGYGEIAKRLAELLAPFRMRLIGVRRVPRGDEAIEVVGLNQLDKLLPSADHVINVLPANDASIGIFNDRRFEKFKRGAYFYNIGRGVTVVQEALLQALEAQRIRGAFLDVTNPEPLPPEHPLWRAPNCFITPHTAGGFREEMQGLVYHFLENLKRFTSGQPLLNRVLP